MNDSPRHGADDDVDPKSARQDPETRFDIECPLSRHAAERMTDAELVGGLADLGLDVERETFADLVRDHDSAESIVKALQQGPLADASELEIESIWYAIDVLWERWLRERPSFEMIDDAVQRGYELAVQGHLGPACDRWLEAWRWLVGYCDRRGITTVRDLDRRLRGTRSVSNWMSDVEMELGNAARLEARYRHDRIAYCREALERFTDLHPSDAAGLRKAVVESCEELGMPVPELPPVRAEARAPGRTDARSGRIGRNDPCPCGSGRKFKKCCLGRSGW